MGHEGPNGVHHQHGGNQRQQRPATSLGQGSKPKDKTMRIPLSSLLAFLLWTTVALAAAARQPSLRTEANVPVELTFTARGVYGDAFNEVILDVTFIHPGGRELR